MGTCDVKQSDSTIVEQEKKQLDGRPSVHGHFLAHVYFLHPDGLKLRVRLPKLAFFALGKIRIYSSSNVNF